MNFKRETEHCQHENLKEKTKQTLVLSVCRVFFWVKCVRGVCAPTLDTHPARTIWSFVRVGTWCVYVHTVKVPHPSRRVMAPGHTPTTPKH